MMYSMEMTKGRQMDINTDLGGDVERGLKLLSVRHRQNHPRAQVQTLRRIATRAQSDADWLAGIPTKQNPRPPGPDGQDHSERIAQQRRKAKDALAAMQHLNRLHRLGYGG